MDKIITVNEEAIQKDKEISDIIDKETECSLNIIPKNLEGKSIILEVKVLDTSTASSTLRNFMYNEKMRAEFSKLGIELNTIDMRSIEEIKQNITDYIISFIKSM